MIHETPSIQPLDPAPGGWRDTLVPTFLCCGAPRPPRANASLAPEPRA